MKRVLLVSMPWQSPDTPSLQVGALKAFLATKGVATDARHLHLQIIRHMPVADYVFQGTHGTLDLDVLRSLLADESRGFTLDPEPAIRMADGVKRLVDEFLRDTDWDLYDLVGMTVTTVPMQLTLSVYAAERIKKLGLPLKIVFGGFSCTGEMGERLLLRFPAVDYAVSGEGEETLAELVTALRRQDLCRSEIRGLIWRNGERVVRNLRRETIADLDCLPVPDYSEYFDELGRLQTHSMRGPGQILTCVETSRGCRWGKCSFCNHNLQWGGTYRSKTAARVFFETRTQMERYGVSEFLVVDNMCRDDEAFWRELAANGDAAGFHRVAIRADMSPARLSYMKKAGVREVMAGIESFSSRLLREMNKGTSLFQNVRLMKACAEEGVTLMYNLIIGFPAETVQDLKDTLGVMDALFAFDPPSIIRFELKYGTRMFNLRRELTVKSSEAFATGYDMTMPYSTEEDREQWYSMIKSKIQAWRGRYKLRKPAFFQTADEESIVIVDGRGRNRPQVLRLRDFAADILRYCDEVRTRADIERVFVNQAGESAMRGLLDCMVKEKLILRENDRFMGIVPRAEQAVLGRYCVAAAEVKVISSESIPVKAGLVLENI